MSSNLHWIVPAQPQPDPSDILVAYNITHHFYREVEYRDAFERHCQWYRETAEMHQQEWRAMQGDLNILGWFRR
jgi:hypothetical protein